MATAGHPQVGSPLLGRRTYVAKGIRATPSRIASCLEPNLLKTALWSLPGRVDGQPGLLK